MRSTEPRVRAEMLHGLLKVVPAVGALAAISVKDLALWVAIMTALSGVLIVGAIAGAAKAWRERAEARTDEAKQAGHELHEAQRAMAELRGKLAALELELQRRPDLSALVGQNAKEHAAMMHALEALERHTTEAHTEMVKGIAAATSALQTLAAGINAGTIGGNG